MRRHEERRRSSARAGTAAADFASRRIDAYLRRKWRPLLIFVLGSVALAAAIWFLPSGSDGLRGFSAGVFLAANIAATYHWVVLASGAAGVSMGQAAEEWTSSELRRLKARGWRTVDHLILRPPGDIDHVAVGPDGVLVVETKWTSMRTDLSQHTEWLDAATRQVRKSERELAGHLGWRAHKDARITRLLVVWGPEVEQEGDEPLEGPNEVNVLAGRHLRAVLDDLGAAHLDAHEVDRIYAKLAKQMDLTDRWANAEHIDRSPTLSELANAWAKRFGAGAASFTLSILSVSAGWTVAAITAVLLVGAGIAAKAHGRLRPLTAAWLIGVGIAAVVLLGAIATAAVAT